jgi:hypothetical protein
VYKGDDLVGYMRLRHGWFRAEHKGETVYEANPNGDGCFECDERERHLNLACAAIKKAMEEVEGDGDLYTIETDGFDDPSEW